jgi:hypothetical protein
MHPEQDFDLDVPLPDDADALTQDLGLDSILDVMAAGDELVLDVARHALLSGLVDPDAIAYRQYALTDSLRQAGTVRELYEIAGETLVREHRIWRSVFTSPSTVLDGALQAMELYLEMLGRLREIASDRASDFESEAFTRLFATLVAELGDDYLAEVREHLQRLKFTKGVLLSARLGHGNVGIDYVLRTPIRPGWKERLTRSGPKTLTLQIANRDEAGVRAVGELRDRGINIAANVLAQAAEHILSFFTMLRRELAFYIGCLNLDDRLQQTGQSRCMPAPVPSGSDALTARGVYDCGLTLRTDAPVVGNDIDAEGASLLLITGANQGGKSTFLRSLGIAQLMMQAGMFVAAESYSADVRERVFTHFKREEDETMQSGKFDEELGRMSAIAGQLRPGAMVLFNESFAATNEQEGSEIARQIIRALRMAGVKVMFVTHMYDLAAGLYREADEHAAFLRAQRGEDGSRTFRLLPGAPMPTSYGPDLYERIFGAPHDAVAAHE